MATAPHTLASLSDISKNVAEWVAEVRELTQPDRCTGAMARRWSSGACAESWQRAGELHELNQKSFPAAICTARIRAMWRASSI